MTAGDHVDPYDPGRLIGTVTEIGPSLVRANLPDATGWARRWLHGARVGAGDVGEFVAIECAEVAIFGRIHRVELPEKDRLSVEPALGERRQGHPSGTIQLLATVSMRSMSVIAGIQEYPRLGARVFSASPRLVKWVAESSQRPGGLPEDPGRVTLDAARLAGARDTIVSVAPERLFGRHCAILGATGGGKSWSLARLLEECTRFDAKVLLLDATGEFYRQDRRIRHTYIGERADRPEGSVELVFPYRELEEGDLVALFTPAGQTQGPKMREAVRSLKLAARPGVVPPLVQGGLIPKAGNAKAPFEAAVRAHAAALGSKDVDFDVSLLPQQIQHECVWPSANYGKDHTKWGDPNPQEYSNCVSLIARIEGYLSDARAASVFRPGGKRSFSEEYRDFLADRDSVVLRLSLKFLPDARNIRSIVVNAIGRHLLRRGVEGLYRERPVVVFLDEAHQFLARSLGPEDSRHPLDAFELLAKEGRKYGITLCIATQRPRDVPEGVLGQMGALVVHRLISDSDLKVVERACSDIDRSAASFLPVLAPGQAVLVGVDFPIPLTIEVERPEREPDSSGPDYQRRWRRASPGEDATTEE